MTFRPRVRLIFRLVRNREELGMYTQISLFVKHYSQEKRREMKLYFPRTENFFGSLEHRFSNQFFRLQDETFNPQIRVSALTSYPNVKKF